MNINGARTEAEKWQLVAIINKSKKAFKEMTFEEDA